MIFETFSKSLSKVRENFRKDIQKRPNAFILGPEGHFLKVFGSYWLLLVPIGSYWLLLAPLRSCWLLLAPLGSQWLLLAPIGAPIGSSWLPVAPIGSYWLPVAPIYWLLFAPIVSSWLLLAPIGSSGPLCDDLLVFFKKMNALPVHLLRQVLVDF